MMKNGKLVLLLLLGLLILGSTTAFGQNLERVGKKLTYAGITYKVKEASSVFEQDTACLNHYNLYLDMHRKKNFWRNTGLVLLGAGVTIHLLTAGQGGDKQVFHERLGRSLPLVLFGGVGTVLVLTSTLRTARHLTDSIDCFNARGEQGDHSASLQIGAAPYGVGLVYSF